MRSCRHNPEGELNLMFMGSSWRGSRKSVLEVNIRSLNCSLVIRIHRCKCSIQETWKKNQQNQTNKKNMHTPKKKKKDKITETNQPTKQNKNNPTPPNL